MVADIHDILRQYWGYDEFRPLQEDIIRSVLEGHDTLGMLPTGGGKSITFQVPALAMGGLTLVVTPLIALMKDQVDHLQQRGIKAAAVYLGMTHEEVVETYDKVITQDYNFLYLSPERIETRLFQAKLQYMHVSMIVVDEAHCISQWGYDFRPSYLKIAELRRLLDPTIPVLALTATATPVVMEDIKVRLEFRRGSATFKASFVRPNLTYTVSYGEDKLGMMVQMLSGVECAIVYVRSRKKAQEMAEQLEYNGINATFYHAGLSPQIKLQRQDEWMEGKIAVMVTTNAFGMGIDKPNVRLVIHLDIPPSPEEYFQEAGRAGRDGLPARAVMLAIKNDKSKLLKHLQDEYPERDFIRLVYEKLAFYFQIAIGSGNMSSYEFDLFHFCYTYRLSQSAVYYAIKLLQQAGYLVYQEDPERMSRVKMTCSREHLYYIKADRETERVLNALLRTNTGLFSDYVFFSEKRLMDYTGFDRETVYQQLQILTRMKVLHYVPARQKPAILYLSNRLDTDQVRISRDIFEERRLRQEERVKAIIDYVDNRHECRLKQLLLYFGETSEQDCGKCDVCLSKTQGHPLLDLGNESGRELIEEIHGKIVKELTESPSPLLLIELTRRLSQYDSLQVAEVVRMMISMGEICMDANKYLHCLLSQ